jgi:hypothetical protein
MRSDADTYDETYDLEPTTKLLPGRNSLLRLQENIAEICMHYTPYETRGDDNLKVYNKIFRLRRPEKKKTLTRSDTLGHAVRGATYA